MTSEKNTMHGGAIKVGVVMDETGPLAPLGIACGNTARMVVEDINAAGGLLGRSLQLILEDSETNDNVAGAKAEKLVRDDRVDVVLGGIYSSTRQAIKRPSWSRRRRSTSTPSSTKGRKPIR